jgi:hypothetical protein
MSHKRLARFTMGGLALALGMSVAMQARGESSGPNRQAEPAPGQVVRDGQDGRGDYQQWATQVIQDQLAEDQAADEAFDKLSPAERQEFLQALHERARRESLALTQAVAESESLPSESCARRGVREMAADAAIPMPFHVWELIVSNYWGGVVNGVCEGVYSGYNPKNPMQGVLVVWDLGVGPWRSYPAPTATGPLTIVSEQGDILKLVSLKGTYYTSVLTPPQLPVDTPGGETYTFDLRTREYR